MSEPTTAGEVLRACVRHWDIRKDHIIPRCCLTGWEADLLIIKPSGWAEEVEIKVSKSDFRAEFRNKAEKHEDLKLGRCQWISWHEAEKYPAGDPRIVERRSMAFKRVPTLIRRFWFAMPKSLAEAVFDEVPAEYGVLAVEGWSPTVLRPAQVLPPARKLTDSERIHALQSAYFRWWQDTLREGAGLEHLIACPEPEFHSAEPLPVVTSEPVLTHRQLTLEVSA